MNLIILLPLLVFPGFGMPAIVEINNPNSVVDRDSNITISVTKIFPNVSSHRFDRLDCAIISPDDQSHKKIVAQYDRHSLMFKAPSHGIPEGYRNRISYVGNLSFVIKRIQFSDKFLKVMCILNYKNGSVTNHVESNVYEIKFVYASPKFQLYTTKEGNVQVIQGQKNEIQCIVKSFPQSNISWETSVEISAYKMKTRKTQGKKEITTTSIFILDSPIPNHEGKGVSCVARPRYGEILRRQYTLIYKPGEKKGSKKDQPNLGIALASAFGDHYCYYVIVCTLLRAVLSYWP